MNEQVYQVGKFYNVTCVVLKKEFDYGDGYGLAPVKQQCFFSQKQLIPVVGPPHDDVEYINFPDRPYHVDWRFAPQSVCNLATEHNYFAELGMVVDVRLVEKTVVRRMKCRREFRMYPDKNGAKFLPALQKGFADKSAKNGICPHKGFDLNTLHPDADSCVVCPLHGLKFNTTTWQLVERL